MAEAAWMPWATLTAHVLNRLRFSDNIPTINPLEMNPYASRKAPKPPKMSMGDLAKILVSVPPTRKPNGR